MYDSKTTVKVGSQVQRQDTQSDYDRAEKKKQSELYAENMVKIMLGDNNESSDGANFFKTKTGNQFTKTVGDGGKFTVTNSEGQTVSFNLSDDPIKIAQSLIGALGVDEKIVSESQVVERVKQLLKGKQANTTSIFDTGPPTKKKDEAPMPAAAAATPIYLPSFELKQDKGIASLKKAMDELGITMEGTGYLSNYVTFTAPNGEISPVEIGFNMGDKANESKAALEKFIADLKAAQNK
jgi:hypothetical protein